jgi:hypothetical protein
VHLLDAPLLTGQCLSSATCAAVLLLMSYIACCESHTPVIGTYLTPAFGVVLLVVLHILVSHSVVSRRCCFNDCPCRVLRC